eukprot:EG_transcript_26455
MAALGRRLTRRLSPVFTRRPTLPRSALCCVKPAVSTNTPLVSEQCTGCRKTFFSFSHLPVIRWLHLREVGTIIVPGYGLAVAQGQYPLCSNQFCALWQAFPMVV